MTKAVIAASDMTQQSAQHDVLVIGSGAAGLTAALALAEEKKAATKREAAIREAMG